VGCNSVVGGLLSFVNPQAPIHDGSWLFDATIFTSIMAWLHFKNGDKNEIYCRQTRKIAQIISVY